MTFLLPGGGGGRSGSMTPLSCGGLVALPMIETDLSGSSISKQN